MNKLTSFLFNFTFLLLLANIASCAPSMSKYRYVSLEDNKDISVEVSRKVGLKSLSMNSEIPVEYVLKDKAYMLKFSVGDKSYYPHLRIEVQGVSETYALRHRRDMAVISPKGIPCASYYEVSGNDSALDFGWSIDCLVDREKVISFDVVDDKGELVSSRDIPFTIKADGVYYIIDAI